MPNKQGRYETDAEPMQVVMGVMHNKSLFGERVRQGRVSASTKITHTIHCFSSQFHGPEIKLKVLFWNSIGACFISPLTPPPLGLSCGG